MVRGHAPVNRSAKFAGMAAIAMRPPVDVSLKLSSAVATVAEGTASACPHQQMSGLGFQMR